MAEAILIYGAYGYTGQLIARRAAALGLRTILAGRDAERVRPLATGHDMEWRAFTLDKAAAHFGDIAAVLNVAGPFSRTAAPMVDACLATGTHYVDVTGEIGVFEALHERDAAARRAGIVILPGAGFDVVPSDCLAAYVHRRLPGATELQLVIGGMDEMSRGTARTAVESLGAGTAVRIDGAIRYLSRTPRGSADLGQGLRPTFGVSWGDVATAYWSTGIPNIEVFFEIGTGMERAARAPDALMRLMGSAPGRWFANRLIDRMPPGPDEAAREAGRAIIIAEVRDSEGGHVAARLDTPEPYRLTAATALEIARRVAGGEAQAGYQTPAAAFGPSFILGFAGVTRQDL